LAIHTSAGAGVGVGAGSGVGELEATELEGGAGFEEDSIMDEEDTTDEDSMMDEDETTDKLALALALTTSVLETTIVEIIESEAEDSEGLELLLEEELVNVTTVVELDED
jgi:hypothetical protein